MHFLSAARYIVAADKCCASSVEHPDRCADVSSNYDLHTEARRHQSSAFHNFTYNITYLLTLQPEILKCTGVNVRAPNIGNTEPSENSQGKGGDLRSKYYPTLTVVRKT